MEDEGGDEPLEMQNVDEAEVEVEGDRMVVLDVNDEIEVIEQVFTDEDEVELVEIEVMGEVVEVELEVWE